MQTSRPFEGKVTLVTGGNTGIGRGITEAFAQGGAHVVVAYLDPTNVTELVESVSRENDVRVIAEPTDIRDSQQVVRLMQRVRSEFGRLDHLICNAAAQFCEPFLEMTDEQILEIVHTNLIGTINCIREGAKLMLENAVGNRSIVILSSINALMAQIGLAVYGATKGALESLTKALSVELGKMGIRVNAIRPGPTATERTLREIPDYHRWGEVVPTGRVSEVSDIAAMATFLCSSGAANVNGAIVEVDGALSKVRARPPTVRPG